MVHIYLNFKITALQLKIINDENLKHEPVKYFVSSILVFVCAHMKKIQV